jgi:hypothetical protein
MHSRSDALASAACRWRRGTGPFSKRASKAERKPQYEAQSGPGGLRAEKQPDTSKPFGPIRPGGFPTCYIRSVRCRAIGRLFNPIHTALIDSLRGHVAEAPARTANVNGLMGKREKYRSVTKRAKCSDLKRQWGSRDSFHRFLGRSLAEFTMKASPYGTRTRDPCRDGKVVWRLSTTWKSTDATASHWKYIIGNVIVYRDVYLSSSELLSETSDCIFVSGADFRRS